MLFSQFIFVPSKRHSKVYMYIFLKGIIRIVLYLFSFIASINMADVELRNRAIGDADGPEGVDEAGIYEPTVHLRRQVSKRITIRYPY